MKGHPAIGAEALSIAEKQLGSSSFLRVAKEISLTHHENWNGSGYPNQLSGEDDIPISGPFNEALWGCLWCIDFKRVYKPAFTHGKPSKSFLEGNGSHFDPQVVQAFLSRWTSVVKIAATIKDGRKCSEWTWAKLHYTACIILSKSTNFLHPIG